MGGAFGGGVVGLAGDLAGGGGGVLPAGGGGVFPAGGGGGVFPVGGGGGVLPAGGGGGVLPAGGGGGVFPAGAVVFPGAGGGVLPAGGGVLVPAAGGAFPAAGGVFPAAGFAADFESPGFAADFPLSAVLAASVAAGVGVVAVVALTFFGFPKSSSVFSGKTSVTIPAAIVFPPSLRANREPLVIVIGKLSFALIVRLSPGLAILTPSGSAISAAVSAVLK